MRKLRVTGRVATIASAATLLVGIAAVPAQAASLSTTGASGRYAYYQNGTYQLYAKDTLTDGHCARWQERSPGASWQWVGGSVCTSYEQPVGWLARMGNDIRICRTGIGNCSTAVRL